MRSRHKPVILAVLHWGDCMDIKRLRWASRRGMLELDLILRPFLDKLYPTLSDRDQGNFSQLLACEDQELYNWLLGKAQPEDSELQRIVKIIRDNTGLNIKS